MMHLKGITLQTRVQVKDFIVFRGILILSDVAGESSLQGVVGE